ncbi:DUF2637 domain-containing protein [Frankia gtarii]|uniref:DUF2637 domain-containing protein n=1 Tax=Frankia gtarii TaxID=2950102 RepID=UPI0021C0EA8C|nr:DUF2637 domain-containing protein [Frankia gtarii]
MSEGRSSGVRAERAIRITTVIAVTTVAVVAAFVSYRHMRGVAMAHGEDSMTAAVLPFSVDGLIVAASMAMLAERRAGRNRSWLSYVLLALGACASLLANVLHAEPTVTARIIAGWPPLALLGSYELLMRQIHPTARRSVDDPVTTVLPIPPQRGPAPTVPAATFPAATFPAATFPAATVAAPTVTADVSTTEAPPHAPESGATDDPGWTDSRGPSTQADDDTDLADTDLADTDLADTDLADTDLADTDLADTDREGADRANADRMDAASPAGLDGAADPAVKREAIVRTLDQTGGSVTQAVAVLAAQGITVSRSWVYQVRRNTPYADVNTGPSARPVHRPTVRGRRRGMASERSFAPTTARS